MKKIIKTLILATLFGGVSVSYAEAGLTCRVGTTCTSAEVAVMDMYGTTNAHAALPDTGHAYLVCCGGVSGLDNSCTSTQAHVQVVAKLSAASNAHVRQGDQSDYPGSNKVCLGDWPGTISIGYQDNNCNGYDTTVFSMAKVPTNSHVGDANAYSHKICARYNAPPTNSNPGSTNQNSSSSGSFNSQVSSAVSSATDAVSQGLDSLLGLFGAPSGASSDGSSSSGSSVNQGTGETSQPTITNGVPDNGGDSGPSGNVLAAAAGLSGSSFMNNLGTKIGSIIALFGLIFVGRKLYLGKKQPVA